MKTFVFYRFLGKPLIIGGYNFKQVSLGLWVESRVISVDLVFFWLSVSW